MDVCVWVIAQGIWLGFFILWCQLRWVKHHLMSYEFTELWLSLSFDSLSAYTCAFSYLSLFFLWLFPSLLLSLVFLSLFHWPVSWLDNANTLFITLHSFSGLYGMPSNQAIVSYGARELITRHRTSVKAISYETWHSLKWVEAERTSCFHRLMLLWSSCTCTKSHVVMLNSVC